MLIVYIAPWDTSRRVPVREAAEFLRFSPKTLYNKTKKGEPDHVPVPPAGQRVLDKLCDEARCEWLFPNRWLTGSIHGVDAAFGRAKRKAGIMDFRFHDIRHTAISYMIMAGVDHFTIAQLAGHTTPTMIEQRYGHLSPRHRQASSILFGSYMDRLTGEAPALAPFHSPQAPIVVQVAGLLCAEQPAQQSNAAPV
jgi:integrase